MRPGDMDQWEIDNERAWRGMVQIGIVFVFMLFAFMLIGIGIGFMIWGLR